MHRLCVFLVCQNVTFLSLICIIMFDRIKKLLWQAKSNETIQQVTNQVQQWVEKVQATAQSVVDKAKDIHTEVMADGKIDMNDLAPIKEVAQNLAGHVNTLADQVVDHAENVIADVKETAKEIAETTPQA